MMVEVTQEDRRSAGQIFELLDAEQLSTSNVQNILARHRIAAEQRCKLEGARLALEVQPINTAPRDGTVIQLYGGCTDEDGDDSVNRHRPVTGFWTPAICGDQHWIECDWWAVSYWDSAWRTGYINPTHWSALDPAKIVGEV